MSAVNITNVAVLDNPASFLTPFSFEISYECVTALKDDLEWKLIYVGSAEDETYDQLLESVLVGPVNVGNYRFVLQADPPDPSKIREEDIIGVTVLLLTCSYMGQEFIRVGYYVNNDYDDEQLREEPPQKIMIDRVQRNILTDKPRVTKFPINFHPENGETGEQAPTTDSAAAEADELEEGKPPSPTHVAAYQHRVAAMEEESPLLRNGGVVQKTKWELFAEETKKVGFIAAPMVVVTVSQHLSRVASMMMVGHLGELALSGAAVATSFTNVSGLSLLFGMASALETLCGQAFGAEQYQKLGTYTYASIISLLIVCIPISILWIFMDKLLIFMGQDPSISVEAGRYAILLIPTLFPYAILQSLIRYLQTQSLILPMVLSSIAALSFHVPVSWALVFKANLGIAGAALAIGLSYWLNVVLLALYVKHSSACERTRGAWSRDILPSMREFFCFAVPSAVMVCLEWWSFEIVVLLSGLLPNPQLETSVLSICLLIASLHYFIPYSIGAAASTRVSNELGAGCADRARASTWSAMVLSLSEAVVSCSILLGFSHVFGYAFSNEKEVMDYLQEITPFVCLLLLMDCIQAVLSGVARGSGWQHLGAYVNLGAYYLAGLPTAAVLGFALRLRGKGLWFGLNVGSVVQSILLSLLTCFTNWKQQALLARERILEGTKAEGGRK